MEVKTDDVTYQCSDEMVPEAVEVAQSRIAQLTDAEKHQLICLPVLGWENERLLLQNRAPYSWRIAGEALATSRVLEMDRIKVALQNLRDEWGAADLQHGGKVADALGKVFEELDSAKTTVQNLRSMAQDETTRGLPERRTFAEIEELLGVGKSTISIYLKQMRDEDKDLDEDKRRIQTPVGGQPTQREYEHLCEFVNGKVSRPKARRKAPHKRAV